MELAIALFLVSLIPLGIARIMFIRAHAIHSFSRRERINGRFTGATETLVLLDNGKTVHPGLASILIVPGILLAPILVLAYFVS